MNEVLLAACRLPNPYAIQIGRANRRRQTGSLTLRTAVPRRCLGLTCGVSDNQSARRKDVKMPMPIDERFPQMVATLEAALQRDATRRARPCGQVLGNEISVVPHESA